MDDGIADTINRRTAKAVAERLDALDAKWANDKAWHVAPMSDTFLGANDATDSDRAWFFAILATNTPGIDFTDDAPAGADWENLFAHFRTEILARRDPQTPPARTAESHPCGVV